MKAESRAFDTVITRLHERDQIIALHEAHIAELERALRESTDLMEIVRSSNAMSGWRYLRGRIAANERLLGGNNDG